MSKRTVSRVKRQRSGNRAFGEASEADLPSAQSNIPTSSALCFRTIAPTYVPPLTTLCGRVFAKHIKNLSDNPRSWEVTRRWLKMLPDALVPKLFTMLRDSCPTLLNPAFVSAFFLRGSAIILTNEMPDFRQSHIASLASLGPSLLELQLLGFGSFPDATFALALKSLTSLRILNLNGCSKVGPKTAAAAAKSCPFLTSVNFNNTAVTPASLAPLLISCTNLEVLKLAGVPNWADATFAKLINGISQDSESVLNSLRTLKLRQTSVSDSSLQSIISICPRLQRLDISFTLVIHPLILFHPPDSTHIQKLSLTSTRITSASLLAIVSDLPQLKTLSIGALGERQGSSATMGNTSALTMNNDTLASLTDILGGLQHLENISLVGNAKLGLTERTDGALTDFIRRVGRKCKSLNLAAIPSLRSPALAGLVPNTAEQGPAQLQTLILKLTSVDDDAAKFISSCVCLETLDVGSTKFTGDGLFPIIDACTRLERLDLTSCRGVNVIDRRRFFEVWNKAREEA